MKGSFTSAVVVRHLGRRDYRPVFEAMKAFTASRHAVTHDELWVVEHPPVFTQGSNGRPEHLLATGDIPVIPVDRGGQVTYHGPGQVVIYLLIDIRRAQLGIRQLVTILEQSVIDLLAAHSIQGYALADAPGVYVDGAKIASLGLRVKRGCCYHGLSLNVDMDLQPFGRIDPCGYRGLQVTQLKDLGVACKPDKVARDLLQNLTNYLGYTMSEMAEDLPTLAAQGAEHA